MKYGNHLLYLFCTLMLAYGICFGTTWTSYVFAVCIFAVGAMAMGLISNKGKDKKKKTWNWKYNKSESKDTKEIKDSKRTVVCAIGKDVPVNKVHKLVKQLMKKCTPERDEIAIVIDSPGGEAGEFHLASQHLMRLKEAGYSIVSCVDKVAASGGYLMACTAQKIIASPWATVGSIGVVAQLFNFSKILELLKIDVLKFVAGKFKAPLDQFAPVSDVDRDVAQNQVNKLGTAFRSIVKKNRPNVDDEKVFTADTFFGDEAIQVGLVDELKSSDAYFEQRNKEGRQIVKLSYKKNQQQPTAKTVVWKIPFPF